jgi:hypothetical protein
LPERAASQSGDHKIRVHDRLILLPRPPPAAIDPHSGIVIRIGYQTRVGVLIVFVLLTVLLVHTRSGFCATSIAAPAAIRLRPNGEKQLARGHNGRFWLW